MTKADIIRKLTSRKMWAMVAGLVTNILIFYNFPENEIAQIVAVIGAFGSIISYIFAEASVDKKYAQAPIPIINVAEELITPKELINVSEEGTD